jgi:hypothetical protein
MRDSYSVVNVNFGLITPSHLQFYTFTSKPHSALASILLPAFFKVRFVEDVYFSVAILKPGLPFCLMIKF